MNAMELFEHELFEAEKTGLVVKHVRITIRQMVGVILASPIAEERLRQMEGATYREPGMFTRRRLKTETEDWREVVLHPATADLLCRQQNPTLPSSGLIERASHIAGIPVLR